MHSSRSSHAAVNDVSSRECVASYNLAERQRKAAHAAEMRDEMERLRLARMQSDLAEAARKRELHDAVKRAALEGPGALSYHHAPPRGGYPAPLSPSQPSSPYGSHQASHLGYELEGVRRVRGGGYGYSTDEGRPHSPPRHAYDAERDGLLYDRTYAQHDLAYSS